MSTKTFGNIPLEENYSYLIKHSEMNVPFRIALERLKRQVFLIKHPWSLDNGPKRVVS